MTTGGLELDWFVDALKKGRGRALARTLAAGALPDEAAVIDASVHHRGHDFQSEGSRAPWMLEILDAGAAAERLSGPIIEQARTEFRAGALDSWDLIQSCELLGAFARRGSEDAHALLHEVLATDEANDATAAYEPLLALEGVAGLLRIASAHGARFAADQDDRWVDEIGWRAEEHHDAAKALAALEAAAAHDAGVRAVLDYQAAAPAIIEAQSRARAEARKAQLAWSPARVLAEVEKLPAGRTRTGWLPSWAIAASASQLGVLLDALEGEQRVDQLCRLLVPLSLPKVEPERFVRAVPRLLALAAHHDKEVRSLALRAAARLRDPLVRAFAIDRLEGGSLDSEHLGLLETNYQSGDHQLIESLGPDLSDDGEAHAWCGALLEIFQAHPSLEGEASLKRIYEQTPCANCRGESVALMLELELLPAEWADECRFDSRLDTRALVATEER